METITLNEMGTVTIQTVTEQQVALASYIGEQQRNIEHLDRTIADQQVRKEEILAKLEQLLTPVENTVVEEEQPVV